MKSFVRRHVLKQRHKITLKWPIQVAVGLVVPSPSSFQLIFQTWTNVMIIPTIVKLEVSVWILRGVTAVHAKRVTRSVMEEATALVRWFFSFLSFFIKSFENIASNTIGDSRCECTTGYKLIAAGDACVGEKLDTRDEKLLCALH